MAAQKRLIIAVTGTPGTGKSTFAKRLAKKLGKARIIEINDVAKKHRCYSGRHDGARVVNLGKLNKAIAAELGKTTVPIIIVGHLAQEIRIRYNIAVVLRLDLITLAKRLERRKYGIGKISENLQSELVDYCGMKMARRCKETYEAESDSEKGMLVAYLSSIARKEKAPLPTKRRINRRKDLMVLIKDGNKYGL